MKTSHSKKTSPWWLVLGILATYLLLNILIGLVIPLSSASNYIVAAISIPAMIYATKKLVPKSSGLGWRHIPKKIKSAIIVTYVLTLIHSVIAFNAFPLSTGKVSTSEIIAYMIFGVILAPIGEELLMRRLIFQKFRYSYGFLSSAIISTIIFTLLHANAAQMSYVWAMGLTLATIYELTRNVRYTILGHMGANLIAIGASLTPYGQEHTSYLLALATGLITLLSACHMLRVANGTMSC